MMPQPDENNCLFPVWSDTLVAITENDAASVAGFAFAGLSFAGGYRRTEVADTAQWQDLPVSPCTPTP
jgi:hypothetical protein